MPLLEAIAPAKRLLADKAYDADRLRNWLGDRRIEAIIPGRAKAGHMSAADPRAISLSKIQLAATGASTHVHDDDVAWGEHRNETLAFICATASSV